MLPLLPRSPAALEAKRLRWITDYYLEVYYVSHMSADWQKGK